jgi:hypothetical protein
MDAYEAARRSSELFNCSTGLQQASTGGRAEGGSSAGSAEAASNRKLLVGKLKAHRAKQFLNLRHARGTRDRRGDFARDPRERDLRRVWSVSAATFSSAASTRGPLASA